MGSREGADPGRGSGQWGPGRGLIQAEVWAVGSGEGGDPGRGSGQWDDASGG